MAENSELNIKYTVSQKKTWRSSFEHNFDSQCINFIKQLILYQSGLFSN